MDCSRYLVTGLLVFSIISSYCVLSNAAQAKNMTLGLGSAESEDVVRRGVIGTILPLTFSSLNSSSSEVRSQRKLVGHARMPLHDDLLTEGYYSSTVYIGTPAHEFNLIVDTGSTVTYVPCSTCVHCGKHQDPRFKPDASSSYNRIDCTSAACPGESCDANKQCKYARQYAESSTSGGVLGTDLFNFGENSDLDRPALVFGCENDETGDLYFQKADGIMGLGRGRLSVVDQLVSNKVIADSFSLCYGGMDELGGSMILGAIPPPEGMVFTASPQLRSPYYNIVLEEIRVAGTRLPVDANTFNINYGTVLDSGTTYAYLPRRAFIEFKNALISQMKLKTVPGPDPRIYDDTCFAGAGDDPSKLHVHFPTVDFVFGEGKAVVPLAPENYLFRHRTVAGAYCLGLFENENDQTTLLGGILVRNMLVMYDRANTRIGFWRTKCTDLWAQLAATESAHNQSGLGPASAALPPMGSSAPSTGPSQFQLPEADSPMHLNSGIDKAVSILGIELNLTINISYSRFSFLSEVFRDDMVSDLNMDSKQLSILNYTDEGSSMVSVNCVIVPAPDSHELATKSVESIFTRLNGHQVRLSDAFGAYHLTGWKLVPGSRKSWPTSGHLHIILAIFAAFVVVVASGTVAYWYRSRYRGAQFVKISTGDALEDSIQEL